MHSIQIIIGELSLVQALTDEWVDAKGIDLGQGVGIIPLSKKLSDDIEELSNLKDNSMPFSEFSYLSNALYELLKYKSFKGKIGYLETDYFGGTGNQSAILLEREKVIIGPLMTELKWDADKENYLQLPLGENAINQLLKALGVSRQSYQDEFQAIGLTDLRSNEKIIKKYGH